MLNFVLNLLFPPKCGFCGKINSEYLCKKCELKLQNLKATKEINKIQNQEFTYHVYAYYYKEAIRNKIIDYKFNDMPELSNTFVKLLLNNEKICGFLKKYDIIIPVPIHKKRKLERGYNQTELIAKEIANQTHLKLEKNILIKQKNIIPQSSLNKSEREQNIKNAFIAKNIEKIINKKILLFDDIYTTGSTANECAKVLKKQGAKQVGVLTIAKD